MSLFVITVEAWDQTGNGWYFHCAVLAETERGARRAATRRVGRDHTGAHSVAASKIDPHQPGVILIRREEVASDQTTRSG